MWTLASHLSAQDAYAFWIAGFVLLLIIAVQTFRHPPPALRLPRPSAGTLSTMLAWLIIAAVVVVILVTRRR